MTLIKISDYTNKKLCELFDVPYSHMDESIFEVETIGRSAFKGLNHTEETKKLLSEINLGEKNPMFGVKGENHPLYGGHHKPMLGRKGKQHPMFGYKMSEEFKEKVRQLNLGEKNPMFGKKHPILECPHCKKMGAANGMKRWHFSNCKNVTD